MSNKRGLFFPWPRIEVRNLSLASLHFLGYLSTFAREAQTGLPPLLLPFSLSQSPPGTSYYPNWTEARRNKEPGEGKEALPPSLMATSRHSINRRRPTTGFLLARHTKQMSQGPWRVMCITEAIISGGECGQAENSLQLRWSDLFFFFSFLNTVKAKQNMPPAGFRLRATAYTLQKHLSGRITLFFFFTCQDALSAMLSLPTKLYTELGSLPFWPYQTFCGCLPG